MPPRPIGLVFLVAGVAMIVVRKRFIRAAMAGDREFYGRISLSRRFPRFTKVYSTVITVATAVVFIAVGMAILVGYDWKT